METPRSSQEHEYSSSRTHLRDYIKQLANYPSPAPDEISLGAYELNERYYMIVGNADLSTLIHDDIFPNILSLRVMTYEGDEVALIALSDSDDGFLEIIERKNGDETQTIISEPSEPHDNLMVQAFMIHYGIYENIARRLGSE